MDLDLLAMTGLKETANPMKEWAQYDAFSCYKGIPGKFAQDKTVNSHGFISTPEIEVKKKDGTTRIAFLGGSSTAGTGRDLPDVHTWPWKATDNLRASTNQNIDFINGALGGFTTFESYGRLWSRLRFFKPDIVIVCHGWNEMYYFNEIADDPSSWRNNFSLEKSMTIERIRPLAADPYIAWSQVLVRVRLIASQKLLNGTEVSSGISKTKTLKGDFNRNGLNIFRDNLRLIKGLCKMQHIELYVCKQATLVSESNSPTDKNRCQFYLHGFNHGAHVNAFDSIYNIIDIEIDKSNVIDLRHLSGQNDYFYDQVHPTIMGSDSIAQAVARHIRGHFFR